ncbi:hypothetical protein GCM10019059_35770 [Camelimonas fluminis]|uniref:Uncharacterized protein n=1 Tax=Camelimonas fluminis TaxID=1576911 RepID=A0ABV7UFM9_9HYPH|nr:hypothetical protein [Camelimonas fluminis]GHE73007.1 hypothetical protein GCM10019059_35770 [Camelimonas fluminis]
MPVTPKQIKTLLASLVAATAVPREKPFTRHDFDPMHGLAEIRYAAKRGYIAIINAEKSPDRFSFCLTAAGRQASTGWTARGAKHPAGSMLAKVEDLVWDLIEDNPPPEEGWLEASQVTAMPCPEAFGELLSRGYLEVNGPIDVPGTVVRLTKRGRRADTIAKTPAVRKPRIDTNPAV